MVIIRSASTRPRVPVRVASSPLLINLSLRLFGVTLAMMEVTTPSKTMVAMKTTERQTMYMYGPYLVSSYMNSPFCVNREPNFLPAIKDFLLACF